MNRFIAFRTISLLVLLVGLEVSSQAAQSTYNYLAHVGECEINQALYPEYLSGLADGLNLFPVDSVTTDISRITFQIDKSRFVSGTGSQRIAVHQPAGGPQGKYFTLSFGIPPTLGSSGLSEGTLLHVRMRYWAEGFQNCKYRLWVRSGGSTGLVHNLTPYTDASTSGWHTVEGFIPLKKDTNGNFNFVVYVEINMSQDAAQPAAGQFWVDDVAVTSDLTYSAPAPLGNGLRLSTHMYSRYDWLSLLSIPIAIGRIDPHISAMGILTHQPDFKPLFSVSAIYSVWDHPAYGNRDLFDYFDCDLNHPDWFLLDAQGQRIAKSGYPNQWLMDIGNPLVRQRAADSLKDLLSRVNNSDVFLDDVDALIFQDTANGIKRVTLPAYPTDTLWWQQLTQQISQLSQAIASTSGATLMANASNARFWVPHSMPNGGDSPGIAWLPSVSGIVEEFAFAHITSSGQGVYKPYTPALNAAWHGSYWIYDLRAMVENPDKENMVIYAADPTNREMTRYAVASYFLGQHPRTSFGLGNGFTPPLPAEFSIPIGHPQGIYQISQGDLAKGGVFSRAYEKGMVWVNPLSTTTFTVTAPQAGTDWDGHAVAAGQLLSLPPHTGYALVYAPAQGGGGGDPNNTIMSANDLSGTRVFPNPWRSNQHAGAFLTFDQMTQEATIKIYTVSSHWVKTLTTSNGTATWDLTNDKGEKVASGIYIYLVTNSQGQKKKGKLVVIR